MRRLLFPLLAVLAAGAVFPAAGHAYTLGVSDQQASMFSNPLFQPLKIRTARYIAPYDVMRDPFELARLDAWIRGARATRTRMLVHFERSHRRGRERRLPSVAEYTRELRRFKAAYPDVREIGVWNEVNRCMARTGSNLAGQPTCRQERRLAQYYSAARRVFPGRTIVALDLLDEQNIGPALRTLRNFLRFARPRPRVIGFHNYSDTNRFSTSRTRRILQAFRGGRVWLTETGGIVKLGSSFPFNTTRASRALGCMFSLARSNSRIQRLYVYQFTPAPDPLTARFDAGLINPDGSLRPGYGVVKDRRPRTCRR
jgi:hypothetical protein